MKVMFFSDAGFTMNHRALNIFQPYEHGGAVYIYCRWYVVLNFQDVVEFLSSIQTLFDLWVARRSEPTKPPPEPTQPPPYPRLE